MPEKRPVPGDTWKKVVIDSDGTVVGFATVEQMLEIEMGGKISHTDLVPLEGVCAAMVRGTFPSASSAKAALAAGLMATTARRDLHRTEPDWNELDSSGRTIARIIAGDKVSGE